MEVVVKRCLVIAVPLLAFGAFARMQPPRVAAWRTEAWMEQSLPSNMAGFSMVRSVEKPGQSYDAGQRQYDALLPFGIVCRIFTRGDKAIDTVVIAGNDRDTFHDPYFCLPGQNWKITESKGGTIATKKRGAVPASIIKLVDPSGTPHIAAFCYKGPSKMHATQNSLYSDWFVNELKLQKPAEGAFYRFMVIKGDVSESELLKFAADFLDQSQSLSGGVL